PAARIFRYAHPHVDRHRKRRRSDRGYRKCHAQSFRRLMSVYGAWSEQLTLDGENFGADIMDAVYAERAGFDKIYAVNGLPARYTDDLVRMAQVCDVPHSWRVKQCKHLDEVTPEILALGREELARDRADYHANVITYFGARAGGELIFLSAGAVRDKLSRD